MGTKRAFSDVHPSRREQVPQTSRKRQKPDNLGSKSFKKANPVNDLKTRVRSIKRLLARTDDNLPAHIRVAKERELQTTEHELEETQATDRRSKLIARYHAIRFFERQKATKRLKRAKKLLEGLDNSGNSEEQRQRQEEVDEAMVDVNYALYYPLDKPYNSLFPNDEDTGRDEGHSARASSLRGDPEMRSLVKQCMLDGRLRQLRDGRLTTSKSQRNDDDHDTKRERRDKVTKDRATKADHSGKSNKHAKLEVVDDGDVESDGGFFE